MYVAIGLPERLARLRSARMRRLYADALRSCAVVVAYSEKEAEDIRRWAAGARVEFVPFGVDTSAFSPAERGSEVVRSARIRTETSSCCCGWRRAFPRSRFRLVTSVDHARALPPLPGNVALETDLPFDEMRARLSAASVVALPVRENSYSGATTVLLQAMALEKPVVVTRTSAIATGYGLVDGENCRLVPPGDEEAFARALRDVLRDDLHARALAASARATVERELSWERYVDRIEALVVEASSAPG